MTTSSLPTVLTLAGFDPSGGAGLQADIKTIHALGGYALSVASAFTVQNSQGVSAVYDTDLLQGTQALQHLHKDYQCDAIKIGMLPSLSWVQICHRELSQRNQVPSVLDPVLVSSSGLPLIDENAIQEMIETLFPQVTLVTPNLPELNYFLGTNYLGRLEEMEEIGRQLRQLKIKNALIKGGHAQGDFAIDYLIQNLGERLRVTPFQSPRIQVQHDHGTGCTLSSAIALYLAKGEKLVTAVAEAKSYLNRALNESDRHQPHYRQGPAQKTRRGGLHHFFKLD
ncbi:bifunctional hydroxymethylpyrimidine kinase/phosphomethylpyrimidine kinase [Thiomicrorhabdus heinhorstiae]|uniref:hydroxymethylpyrimidine kinase n=1 Tax=Thiomicrorhabdus heinhorstiae TaxID=2748010 RepID=A0ABS0BZR4_9GAMM|nr:bifunctional hydroxymethylpyrimidine kinase/phosphomethylpyrimidine kinase [Thiomicrorhabdus heinhorstiae]MBF6058959.1 bifunctional hydroxymethylpyrimidine kinase/phosphomethylpyrimidine kinase [Thiomicrorhabdus heinhorstiae]